MIKSKRILLGYLGIFLVLAGIVMLMPLLLLISHHETLEVILSLAIPGPVILVIGVVFAAIFYRKNQYFHITKRNSVFLFLIIWIISVIILAIPFWIVSKSFTTGLFEAVSAVSTTNFSLMVSLPEIIYLYKCICSFFGAIGLIIVLLTFIPNRLGAKLFQIEGHSEVSFNASRSSRVIFLSYGIFFIIGTLLYCAFGVPFHVAITLSLSTVSNSGSIDERGNMYLQENLGVEIVTLVLMLVTMFNVLYHFNFFRGRFKKVFKDSQIWFLLIYAILFMGIMLVDLSLNAGSSLHLSFEELINIVIFQFVSMVTSSGLSILPAPYLLLPSTFFTITIIIVLIGGQMETGAGGIKLERIFVAIKGFINSSLEMFRPHNYLYEPYYYKLGEKKNITRQVFISAISHILLFVGLFFFGTILLSIFNPMEFKVAAFNFSNALSSNGLYVGAPLNEASTFSLWVLMMGMFLGRLEILPVILAVGYLFTGQKEQRMMKVYERD
ncbi:MAG: hypothetical protein LBR37_00295 [Erysipelotrichaceae bacterium]|nr:hypothetical protein [Erysipelotrichaceae bacterium]